MISVFVVVNFALNRSESPNRWNFYEFIVSINALNPHKSSVLNYPTSAPSSMPFISNFDFSYPKCHVFESHCRYQRIQSSWLLGWIFWCIGNGAKSPVWARDPRNNCVKFRLLLICCSSNYCNRRPEWLRLLWGVIPRHNPRHNLTKNNDNSLKSA